MLVGAVFAAIVAAVALRIHALTRTGALAALVVGALTYGAGAWPFTLVLLAFFVPSVALSRVGRARKKQLVDIGKGGARDAWQVAANGGAATLFAVAAGFAHGPWVAAFAAAYAAATADTWGTEIGTLARRMPRSILTLRPLATGLSGGVTWPGTLAELGGAAWIALVATVCLQASGGGLRFFLAVFIAGSLGALLDSVLGATVQELRRCPACERLCETNPHVCGTATTRVRGIAGFSNDAVNLAATAGGGIVGLLLGLIP